MEKEERERERKKKKRFYFLNVIGMASYATVLHAEVKSLCSGIKIHNKLNNKINNK